MPYFIRAAILKQVDPNTVSGLLKLHLRENPLLSQESSTALDKAMNGDKVWLHDVDLANLWS